jgi:hypothetical protein
MGKKLGWGRLIAASFIGLGSPAQSQQGAGLSFCLDASDVKGLVTTSTSALPPVTDI